MDSLELLHDFCDKCRIEAKGITIDDIYTKILDMQFAPGKKKSGESDKERAVEFKENYGINLDEHHIRLFYLGSTRMRWRRPETTEKEGYLPGGFAFNGLEDIFESQ